MLTCGYCADDGAERLANRDGGHCFLHNSAVKWILLSSTHWDFIAPRILAHTALPTTCGTRWLGMTHLWTLVPFYLIRNVRLHERKSPNSNIVSSRKLRYTPIGLGSKSGHVNVYQQMVIT